MSGLLENKHLFKVGFWSFCAILLHCAFFFLFSVQIEMDPPQVNSPVSIHYTGSRLEEGNEWMAEELLLMDSTPLFMPTPWNGASRIGGIASLKEAVETFQPYEPDLLLPEEPVLTTGLGSSDLSPNDFIPPVEVIALGRYKTKGKSFFISERFTGPTLVARALAPYQKEALQFAIDNLNLEAMPSGLWQPLKFYVQLEGGTLRGPPVLSVRSGYPEWDLYLLSFLRNTGIYRSLADGYFQLEIHP